MQREIIVNRQLASLLESHGVQIKSEDEFVCTNLDFNAKFKARVVYEEVNDFVNSRLDVMVFTEAGDQIVECFGDVGGTIEEAMNRNFQNFSMGTLHPLLAALGSTNPETLAQFSIEEWSVNGKKWKVFLGNLVPKKIGGKENFHPPVQFFQLMEHEIRAQALINELHWFRAYYCQHNTIIHVREFLVDNEPQDADRILKTLPILPDITFYSCRCFVVLREIK